MFTRKIEKILNEYYQNDCSQIMIVTGATIPKHLKEPYNLNIGYVFVRKKR